MTRRPDLFIVGAPKCGTTSLYNYLQGHPEVFLAGVKEPQFFAGDRIVKRGMPFPDAMDRYLALFEDAGDAKKVGEASTSYLESPEAVERIREFAPDARIVAMLRNPVDMMHSLHGMRVAQGVEPKVDFADAMADEHTRPGFGTVGDQSSVRYRDRVRYADMLPRWFDAFGRERVHVIITEELAAEPQQTFAHLLAFLELSPGYQPASFRHYNTSLRPRSVLLSRIVGRLPHRAVPVSRLDRIAIACMRLLRRTNRRRLDRPPVSPALRERLRAEFAPDVTRLEALLGRDLAGTWWAAADRS
ncbi:MAG: sulfotransferase [Chloroflexota bacterium]